MNRYHYDFHIHSCLSPCGDNDMTPNNIAGMAALAGLQIVALTDHNTSKNCPAFFMAAKKNGIIPIAGMELTTAEDIHVVCLFEQLDSAMEFDKTVSEHLIKVKNRPDIFGDQNICDENDNIIGTYEYLLLNATDIPIERSVDIVTAHGGICFPAHIDREANGIIATLGTIPEDCGFTIAEFHDKERYNELAKAHPIIQSLLVTSGSDAHYLWDIRDAKDYFTLDDEPYSGDNVRKNLFSLLKSRRTV